MARLGAVGTLVAFVAAGIALWAAGRPWYRGQSVVDEVLTGQTLTSGLATALPLAVLAALAAQLVFARTGRRVLAVFAALLGIGAFVAAASTHSTQVLGTTGWLSLRSRAFFGYLGCMVAVVLGALLTVVWPGRARQRSTAATQRDDAWSVLDRGEDPTAS